MRRIAMGAVLGLLSGVLPVVASPPASALVLPPGFQLVDHDTGQAPYNLTNFAWLDNGGLLTSGKDGTITFVPSGGTPRVLTTVPSVRAVGDHGLLGFDLANDYATSGHVYISYDQGDPEGTGVGMVEEWTASPAANPTSFTHSRTLIDGARTSPPLAQTGPTHAIDSVVVAPDDTLWVSIGDDSLNNGDPRKLRAQDLDQPYGKLLHLTAGGEGVPSNPYFSSAAPTSWRSMVYAYGFRNPFRFSLDPRSGIPHLGDVGSGRFEEINTLAPGANAGWPCYEGREPTTFSTDPVCRTLVESGSAHMPILTYPRAGQGASVVGGVHYSGSTYPEQYRNAYFYGDYSRDQLWTLATDTAGNLTRAPEVGGFATGAGGPVAFQTGPNGDVTYADLLSGDVRRLVYTAENRAPVARFTSTTDAASRTVTFSASDTYDLDGDELTYSWDFGDGGEGSGERVVHTYTEDDAMEVTLTVADSLGKTGTATSTVHPTNHTPQLDVTQPPPGLTYAVGDLVELAATATDQEDGPLTVSWDTALRHCPFAGSCHIHPDGTVTGPSYGHSFTDHGADTDMLVTVRAEDSKGATVSATYVAKPTVRTLAVNAPVAVSINGSTATSAQVVAGSSVQVDAPSTPYWRFESWSDSGAAAHSFTMPDADLTLTAEYSSALARKYGDLGAGSSFLGTPTSAEYDVAGGRARNYAGGRLYWSAASGAHAVGKKIGARYLSVGGPAVLGFPTTDERAVPGGRAAYFTKARIYWSPGNGAHVIRGPILAKYLAAGGPARYGLPMTDTSRAGRGRYAHFSGGRSIFWSSATGAHLVHGRVLRKYASMRYQRSCLGFPTTDVDRVNGGQRSRFVGGTITYTSRTGARARCSTSPRR